MITMEDAVKDLFEAGIIDKDEAHRALLKNTEDAGERDQEYASGSLGGGKIDTDSFEGSSSNSSGSGKSDGGYSF